MATYTHCINFVLTIAQHEVFLTFSETLSKFGITPGQYGVLACLWESQGGITPKEIAGALHVKIPPFPAYWIACKNKAW